MNGIGTLLVFLLIFSPAIIFISYGKHDGRKLAIANPNPDFISIDCGAPEDYVDTHRVLYKSDAEFIDSGFDGQISDEVLSKEINLIERQVWNLRSFPNKRRNCYTLNPRRGKNNTYLIRGTFYYGNYDGKNQVPEFDMYIGVNRWVTINLYNTYEEIVYVPSTDYIHVCLVNIGSGTPYISTLELRLLENSIYRIESGALRLTERYDVGFFSSYVYRYYYPADVYDRTWACLDPKRFYCWLPINTTSGVEPWSKNAYKIPDQVLTTAARSQNASVPLNFSWDRTDYGALQYYVYFHFAEIEQLLDGQQREIKVSFTDNNFSKIVRPEYLKPVTVASPPIWGFSIEFTIKSTEGSDLPPILNAFEIFELIELSYSSTIPKDVDAMMNIKQEYQVINRNWQGDPCAPIDYSWDGLNCSYTNLPTIISLNLSSSKLSGKIADSFSELKAIESLDLSNNSLTGTLPEFLAKLPNLKILNLARNNFTGNVPPTLLKKHTDGSLELRLDENPYLCQTNSCKKKSNMKFVFPVVAYVVSVLLLLILLGALLIYWRIKKRRKHEGIVSESKDMKSKNQRFSYSALERITNHFQTVIGEGGFGKVFVGTLHDGTQVAVKLLSELSKQGFKEFRAEAQLLIIVHHRNLVSLIGYCDEGRHMGLIYEYMDNGNLQQHLSGIWLSSNYGSQVANILSWNDRLHIAVDAAQGLEYLHNGCKPPAIHRDLKTSNILLDKNMRAKVADFGLSKVFTNENDTHMSTTPAGTPGYLDPEFHLSGKLNKKSDVYSFGIILFELITGRHALIRGPANQSCHILQWVIPAIEKGDVENIVDPKLNGEFNYNTARKAMEIALSCIPSTAIQRPDMSTVLSELKECLAMEMTTAVTERGNYDMEPINSLKTELDLYPITR